MTIMLLEFGILLFLSTKTCPLLYACVMAVDTSQFVMPFQGQRKNIYINTYIAMMQTLNTEQLDLLEQNAVGRLTPRYICDGFTSFSMSFHNDN